MGDTQKQPPKIFVSYAHESQEHAARVLALSDRLRSRPYNNGKCLSGLAAVAEFECLCREICACHQGALPGSHDLHRGTHPVPMRSTSS